MATPRFSIKCDFVFIKRIFKYAYVVKSGIFFILEIEIKTFLFQHTYIYIINNRAWGEDRAYWNKIHFRCAAQLTDITRRCFQRKLLEWASEMRASRTFWDILEVLTRSNWPSRNERRFRQKRVRTLWRERLQNRFPITSFLFRLSSIDFMTLTRWD